VRSAEGAGTFGEQARQIGVGEGKAEKQVSVNGIKVPLGRRDALKGVGDDGRDSPR
jgi:hypothetical protein